MKKRIFAALVIAFCTVTAFPAYAEGWKKDPSGWRWQFDDETFAANGWYWLDGNNDQIEDCYYFDRYGYILRNTETPDGYQVNPDGSWVVDGVVQTRKAGETAAAGGEAGNVQDAADLTAAETTAKETATAETTAEETTVAETAAETTAASE